MTTNESLKSKRELANKLVQEIIDIKDNVIDIKIDAEDLYRHIELKDNDYKKLIHSLNRINLTTEEAIDNLRHERDRIKTLLAQVNNFYEKKYTPLLQKIEDRDSGFRAKINKSTNELKELEKVKLSCSKQYDEIKKFASNEDRVTYMDFPFVYDRESSNNWSGDGLHFSEVGYATLGRALAPCVKDILDGM